MSLPSAPSSNTDACKPDETKKSSEKLNKAHDPPTSQAKEKISSFTEESFKDVLPGQVVLEDPNLLV